MSTAVTPQNFWEVTEWSGAANVLATMPKGYVLVDGDMIAYRCAAAADGRGYIVDGNLFKYSADAKSYADKRSIPHKDIEGVYNSDPVENALASVASMIETIQNYVISEFKLNPHLKVCLSCDKETNFRYGIMPTYKASRKGKRVPEHLAECKDYLSRQFGAMKFDKFEADDLIAMMVDGLRKINAEQRIIIASNDKDFTQLGYAGLDFYDITTSKTWQVSESEALYKQLLVGDSSDDIPGLPKVGSQTAIALLGGTLPGELVLESLETQLFFKVVRAYHTLRFSIKEVLRNATLLYLVRDEGKVGLQWLPKLSGGWTVDKIVALATA
jgi:5'-3' exonuclease